MSNQNFYYKIRENLLKSWEIVKAKMLFWWILNIKTQTLTVSHKPAIVFAPHQDDETLGCGGLIALKHELGTPIKVVFLTDGQKSHLHIKPEELIQIRKQEAVNALKILGIASSDIYFLDYMDGSLMQLSKEERYQIINQLVQLLQSFQPSEVYLPHRKDKHNDHQATYDLVQAALIESKVKVEVFEYPIWLFWNDDTQLFEFNLQEMGDSYNLCIKSVYNKKQRAIKAYHSQCQIFPSSFLKQFFIPREIFFKRPIQN
ncbi:MAG: PIG-L family deacetylase [Nostoc sp.]|uniref:PIG-L deacetylase family protein n=1 Tax=Nostoc sp. TaxID=1180 RepID=UPI002FF6F497